MRPKLIRLFSLVERFPKERTTVFAMAEILLRKRLSRVVSDFLLSWVTYELDAEKVNTFLGLLVGFNAVCSVMHQSSDRWWVER